ncbi:unnamed protein product [Cyclocybe aegerita]|uniref:PH domain-containing protein n=1 Tax=Cyclocybe aegerita TaxID=1973307 RepID=A0A8S0XLM3_CYCAE|nr:unnamed protein product [Cyclocybe aegerita]
MSRNQSLIKKNIELQDLKPADVLIERFVAWKVIVKQLTSYFEGIADIENNTSRELTKLAGVIQVPFKAGNQFLGDGGLQDVYYDIRDRTRIIADQHADLGRTIDSSIVQHLQKLRAEIKAHIKNVQNDTGKLAATVAKERELSTRLVGELANNISTFKNTPMNLQARQDPYVANLAVSRQLQRQVLEENLLQKSIVMMQQNSAAFEEGIVRSIQSAWATFDEWQSRAATSTQSVFRSLAGHMAGLAPDREWIQFAARSDHLLDPETPLRDPEAINYPLKDDSSVSPVHTGHLERKKRFTRAWAEGYFVLTPAGFLHSFASSDPTQTHTPTFSLFLPSCTLGPPSPPSAKAHKFHIEGRKDGVGTTSSKSGSVRGMFGSLGGGKSGEGAKAWSFRARSREDMMEWWNDIRMLCARYLVASEMVDRTGPVEAAVRAVGYSEEDLEGEEEVDGEEEEGSSVEEEEEEEVDGEAEEVAPPGYTHPEKNYPVEIGPNGYAIEKKSPPGHHTSTNGTYGTTNGNMNNSNPSIRTSPPMNGAHNSAANAPMQPNMNYHASPTLHAGHHHHVQSQQASPVVESTHTPSPRHSLIREPGAGRVASPALRNGNGGAAGPTVDAGVDDEPPQGPGVRRRLSKRQMEKAPEGRVVDLGHDDGEEGSVVVDYTDEEEVEEDNIGLVHADGPSRMYAPPASNAANHNVNVGVNRNTSVTNVSAAVDTDSEVDDDEDMYVQPVEQPQPVKQPQPAAGTAAAAAHTSRTTSPRATPAPSPVPATATRVSPHVSPGASPAISPAAPSSKITPQADVAGYDVGEGAMEDEKGAKETKNAEAAEEHKAGGGLIASIGHAVWG